MIVPHAPHLHPMVFDLVVVAFVVRHRNAPFFSLRRQRKETKERRPAPTAPHGAGGSARRTQGSLQPGGAGFSA